MQLATHGEQEIGRAGEVFDRRLQRRRDIGAIHTQRPADHVVVAQPLLVLQIRLEQRCHVTEALPSLMTVLQQALQPDERPATPLLQGRSLHLRGHVRVTGEWSHGQHRRGGIEVVAGELQQ